MYEDNDFDEYAATLEKEKKRKLLIGGLVAVGAIAVIAGGYYTMVSPASSIVEFVSSEPAAIEQAVIEPMAPPERRAMQVESTPPGAAIIVNGIPTQQLTPASVDVVAGARNTISLFLDGYKTETRILDADANDFVATLTSYVAPERPEGWTPPKGEDGKPLEADPVHGRIRVVTRSPVDRFEGASIWLNGKLMPETSPATFRVQPGEEQHILVRHPGHLDAITYVQAIPYYRENDERGVLLEQQVDRGNAFSAVTIRTFPRDAKVWIDDQEITGNIVTPVARNRHFTIRAEAPGHEGWERTFEATVGTIELSIQLQRPVAEFGSMSVAGLPADADLYLVPLREGAEGGTQIGRKGQVQTHDLESGKYLLRVAWGEYNQRKRKDLEIEILPKEHRHFILSGSEDGIQVSNITNRRPRN